MEELGLPIFLFDEEWKVVKMYFHREAEDLLLSSLITTVPEPKDSSPPLD